MDLPNENRQNLKMTPFGALILSVMMIILPQAGESETGPSAEGDSVFRIVFYNVENLFDTVNDPLRADDDFTPSGSRRWNAFRLQHKIENIYRALAAAGGWNTPAIIGLCEVENMYVLEKLAYETGLKRHDYQIIHRNSDDPRGIDVAVLFRPDRFYLLKSRFMPVRFPFDTLAATRDIVYIKGLAGPADTLHLFANHWPSRWGGQAETAPYRNYAALVLRSVIDSLFLVNPGSKIVVMGDFNDEPQDESLKNFLGAGYDFDAPEPGKLYNISWENNVRAEGSCKYRGIWYLFDQFIVSGGLMGLVPGLYTTPGSFRIFDEKFLLVPDDAWFGYKPFRSFEGFRYTGGYSDHLPVILDLFTE